MREEQGRSSSSIMAVVWLQHRTEKYHNEYVAEGDQLKKKSTQFEVTIQKVVAKLVLSSVYQTFTHLKKQTTPIMNTFCKLKQMRKMCNGRYSTLSKYITRETSFSTSTLSHTVSPAAGVLFVLLCSSLPPWNKGESFTALPLHHGLHCSKNRTEGKDRQVLKKK